MGQLDFLPNTPKLWQSLAHELVRAPLAQALSILPLCSSAIESTLQIRRLSLSVLDRHLEHALGKHWAQGTAAVKSNISQVRVKLTSASCWVVTRVTLSFSLCSHLGSVGLPENNVVTITHAAADCSHLYILYPVHSSFASGMQEQALWSRW